MTPLQQLGLDLLDASRRVGGLADKANDLQINPADVNAIEDAAAALERLGRRLVKQELVGSHSRHTSRRNRRQRRIIAFCLSSIEQFLFQLTQPFRQLVYSRQFRAVFRPQCFHAANAYQPRPLALD